MLLWLSQKNLKHNIVKYAEVAFIYFFDNDKTKWTRSGLAILSISEILFVYKMCLF